MPDRRTRTAAQGRLATLLCGFVAMMLVSLTGCGAAEPDTTAPTTTAPTTTALPPGPTVATSSGATVDGLPAPSTAEEITGPESAMAALALLGTLPVKGRAPQTGYSREQFGQAWSDDVGVDAGHNGCDTRNDVLRRDITDARIRQGTAGCVVLSGTLVDPYTGSVVPFLRGADTSDDVQIDHVVALADAWQSGAQQLTAQQRQDFANDPRNLQATIGAVNQQKGAGDAATWLPPDKSYRCTYIARQIAVKAAYQLWVKPAEKQAMARILEACGAISRTTVDPTTQEGTIPSATGSAGQTPPVGEGTETAEVTESFRNSESIQNSEAFQNCAAARAAGAAPVHIGDPGYSPHLDGDQDGIACE